MCVFANALSMLNDADEYVRPGVVLEAISPSYVLRVVSTKSQTQKTLGGRTVYSSGTLWSVSLLPDTAQPISTHLTPPALSDSTTTPALPAPIYNSSGECILRWKTLYIYWYNDRIE